MILAVLCLVFLGLIAIGIPIAWALAGPSIVILLFGLFPLPDAWMAQQVFRGADSLSLVAIPLFLFAGGIMNEGGLTSRIIAVADQSLGWVRGGLGPVNVGTAMIYGGISGSATADTGAVGTIMIPAMKERGYPVAFAAAVTAASGTLGIVIPPSVVMIMYGVITDTSIGGLFAAGIIPGLLLGLSFIVTSYIIGVRNGFPKSEHRFSPKALLLSLWLALPALVMPLVVIGALVGGFATVTEAAFVAVVWAMLVSITIYRQLTWEGLLRVSLETVRTTGAIMIIMAVAVPFAWLLTVAQVPNTVAHGLLGVFSDPTLKVMIILLILLFAGLWLDTGPALVILAPILHPIAVSLGLDPYQIGLIFTVGLGIGLFTPPVGTNLFVVCNVAKLDLWVVTRAIIPFWVASGIVLLAIAFIPSLTMWVPRHFGF
ncbi:MAG: TRAP transporter large permease [Rhizobiaceae bacterium]